MAYFPNGSAGSDYMERYCLKCVNWADNGSGSEGCYIFDLHMLWNYDACNGALAEEGSEKRAKWTALEHFIPTTKNGLGCEQCRMFRPKDAGDTVIDAAEKMREWEAVYGKRPA